MSVLSLITGKSCYVPRKKSVQCLKPERVKNTSVFFLFMPTSMTDRFVAVSVATTRLSYKFYRLCYILFQYHMMNCNLRVETGPDDSSIYKFSK